MVEGESGFTSRLESGESVTAAGIDTTGVAMVTAAARTAATAEDPWRLVIDVETAERVAYDFTLATTIEQLRSEGRLAVRELDDSAGASLGDPTTGAVVGTRHPESPTDEAVGDGGSGGIGSAQVYVAESWAAAVTTAAPTYRVAVTDDRTTVSGLREATGAQFDAGTPVELDEPGRTSMVESARASLTTAFARDFERALEGCRHLPRADDADVLALVLVVGARHDLLFNDVRTWSESVGIAPRPMYIDVKDDLVDVGIVETIKVPTGSGRPPLRLRLRDEELLDCPATEIIPVLRAKLADPSNVTTAETGISPR